MRVNKNKSLECETDLENTRPAHLVSFHLSNSKRIMNNFIHEIDGLETNMIYYSGTDTLYIEKRHWDVFDKTILVVKTYVKKRTTKKMVEFHSD